MKIHVCGLGFTGSFCDLTKAAHLYLKMRTELFLDNPHKQNPENEFLTDSLPKYADVIKFCDVISLKKVLEDGNRINDEIKAR